MTRMPAIAFRRSWILLFFAIVVQLILFLGWLGLFSLPKAEAWEAGAELLFFASFVL